MLLVFAGDKVQIWTKKKPTEIDLKAAALLLSLRQQHAKKFDDRKTVKSKLWNDIAKTLSENGYTIGENAGERCRQKFANLSKPYLTYIKHQKETGTDGSENVPPFFDELHSILGECFLLEAYMFATKLNITF